MRQVINSYSKDYVMKTRLILIVAPCLFFLNAGLCQQPDTLIKKLDSLNKKTDTVGGQTNIINPKAYNEKTKITFSTYFILLGSDLKQQATAPFHQTGKEWLHIGEFALATGAISLADEPIQRFAIRQRSSETITSVSSYVTRFGGKYETYTLGALGAYGFIFKNEKIKTTTLLATQAYLTSGAMETIIKFLAGRQRPSYYDPNSVEAEPTFRGPFSKGGTDISGKKINNSFPSGHTTVAFAAATVFAMEYKNRPLIPIVAYSAASLVGLSRITENKHWATDVLVGAALGYLCGKQVVNNYHRYAKVKSHSKKNGTLSFNMQYMNGQLIPGVAYTFR
jgi:membrane-associated phospholipid phosphatase